MKQQGHCVGAAAPARLGEAEGSNVLPRGQAGQVLGLLLLGASNQDSLQKQAQKTLQHHPVGKERQLTSSSMIRELHLQVLWHSKGQFNKQQTVLFIRH